MKVLVTGGLGFIGSHTVVELQQSGYEVVIIDDLSNSTENVIDGIIGITGIRPEYHNFNLQDKAKVESFFANNEDLVGVIHFAAFKAVGESVAEPLKYYQNNVVSLLNLLEEVNKRTNVSFIFSSSCTVYGQAEKLPITEESPLLKAESPYGNTKQMGEDIISDLCKSNPSVKAIALRYFNPIGAHKSVLLGELPVGVPQNLIPYITQTAIGKREQLQVFGDDYPTTDGTCIRDYIHVVDLAQAHVKALDVVNGDSLTSNYNVYNLGTGTGSTVLEVVKAFEKVSDKPLNYKIVARREGDITAAYANATKAEKELGWKTKLELSEALKSAWEWEQKLAK